MKNLLIILMFLSFSSLLVAQEVELGPVSYTPSFTRKDLQTDPQEAFRTANCGLDTLYYTIAKSYLGDRTFSQVVYFGLYQGTAQRFEVPTGTPVTVHGFVIAGSGFSGSVPLIRCAIYLADPITGKPSGTALAADTLRFTTTRDYFANFSSPVTVTQNFVLAAEMLDSNIRTAFICNDSKSIRVNGRGEELNLVLYSGAWYKPSNFDTDMIISPIVSYDLSAGMTTNINGPFQYNTNYTFTSAHSELLSSRFFNLNAFYKHFTGSFDPSSSWDFGDGTSVVTGSRVAHAFASGSGEVTVKAIAKMRGYTTQCTDTAEMVFSGQGVGVDESWVNKVELYPNPTDGIARLNLSLPEARDIRVSLYNLAGQKISSWHPGKMQDFSLEMDITNQPTGLYLVHIEMGDLRIVRKLQK